MTDEEKLYEQIIPSRQRVPATKEALERAWERILNIEIPDPETREVILNIVKKTPKGMKSQDFLSHVNTCIQVLLRHF